MLNKIIIDSKTLIMDKECVYYLKINDKESYLVEVIENIKCKLVIISENNDYKIVYNLRDNSHLTVNSLNHNSNSDIIINLQEKSEIIYNYSVVSVRNSINNFKINHLGNNTSSIINNNGINLGNDKLFFVIDGVIAQKLVNINCNQNSKIINYHDGNSKIIPNLIIDSNDINASHSAYIGNFDKKTKFYLASRGLSDKMILKLLYKSILLGPMDLTVCEEEFNKIINEWW